jgi:23S rRNA pseudouridine2605 synthase
MSEKLQKVLARAGIGSRRQIEQWIAEQRISVDGVIAKIGARVTGNEKITLDGKDVRVTPAAAQNTRLLLYHKPEGEICSRSDPEGRPTVFDHLPRLPGGRWISIGRLDINTSGVLLFTNDGELANRLMHPKYEVEREYAVRILGEVTPDMLMRLEKGVRLDDGMAKFLQVVDAGGTGANHWYHVMVREGKNRLVRRLWESQGAKVSRLIRIRFGSITLPRSLRMGHCIEIPPEALST